MPYQIVEQKDKKFKVCKADDPKVCFSKKGIPYKTARKQVRAIVSSENKKGSKKGKGRTFFSGDREINRWYLTHKRKFLSETDDDYDDLWDFDKFKEEYKKTFENTEMDHSDIMKDLLQSNLDEADSEPVTALSPEEIKEKKSMLENQRGMEKAEKETKEYNSEYDRIKLMNELYKQFKEAEKKDENEYSYDELDDFIQEYERLRGDTDYTDPDQILELIIDPFKYTDDDTIKAFRDGKDLYEEIEGLSPNFYMIDGIGNKSKPMNTNNSSLMYLKHFLFNKFEGKTNEKDPSTGVYKKGSETITGIWVDWDDKENFGGDYDEQQVDDWQKNLYGILDIDNIETILYDPNNWLIDRFYKNKVRGDIKNLVDKARDMDSSKYFCQNICAGDVLGQNYFSIATYGLVCYNFYKNGDDIVFSGMDNSTFSEKTGYKRLTGGEVYINTKCSSRYGFISFNSLRQIAQNKGYGDLCYLPNLNVLHLGSLGYYTTVMFYWQQGAYSEGISYNDYNKNSLFQFLERNFEKESFEKAINIILDDLENVRGCSLIKNNLFGYMGEGGEKVFLLDKKEDDYLYQRAIEIEELRKANPNTNILYDKYKTLKINKGENYTNKNPELELKEVIQEFYDNLPTENIDSEDFTEDQKIAYNKMVIVLKNRNKKFKADGDPLYPIPTRKVFIKVYNRYVNENPNDNPSTYDLLEVLQKITEPSDPTKRQRIKKDILSYAKNLNKPMVLEDVIEPVAPKKTDVKGKTGRRPRGVQGSGVKGTKFYEELKSYGISPEAYLKQMKIWAKKSGYDEKQMTLDTDDKHKLRILTIDGTKHFGRVGYKDYYIYRHLEKKKEVKKGYAKIMRDRFRKSHGAISKKRKLGRNSANELSLRILWHEEDDEKEKQKK